MRRFCNDALLYFAASGLSGLGIAAASFWLLRSSYAGVSDEGVVEAGMSAFKGYLRTLGWLILGLDGVHVLVVATVTLGLLAVRAPTNEAGQHAARGGWPRFLRFFGLAAFVQLACLGAQAGHHPGLFLSLLSANVAGPVWVAVARIAWPFALAGSLAGWVRLAFGPRGPEERWVAVLGVLLWLGWCWPFEVRGEERLSRARPAGRAGSPADHSARRWPNILLIGVDSLRPDKIDDQSSPALARLCRESIYFPKTLVTLPRTAPSWVALLTSLPPLGNGVETMFPSAERSRLASLALPAHLASLGYATTVSSEYAGELFGRVSLGFENRDVPRVELEQMLGQGFLGRQPAALGMAGQLYASSAFVRMALPAPLSELMRGLASFSHPYVVGADFVERIDHSRPWFGLLFYSQPHFPYTSSSPFNRRSAVPGSDSALRFGKDVTRGEVKTAADRSQVEALYRSALAETDAAVGDLFARLESSGDLEDTIVILTADHGEGLYECPDCVGHGDSLRGMMTLEVPLAIRLPRGRFPAAAPALVGAYVSQLDVYPTILALLGVVRPPVQEGIALLTSDGARAPLPEGRIFYAETGEWLWPTGAVPTDRIVYPPITALATIEDGRIVIQERHLPVIRAAKHRAAILPPYKLVYRPTAKSVQWSLYDMARDPLDEHDLTASLPDIAANLRSLLVRSVLRYPRMLAEGDYFLTRPAPPLEEYY